LISSTDDGIVVVTRVARMPGHISVDDYFNGDETLRRIELVHGVLREPPAPRYGHQSLVTRTTVLLDQHVRSLQLGRVCVSPVDVVLDKARALVLQPDVVFVSNDRAGIIQERIWGAPDLVVEVLSRGTSFYDRHDKLAWYADYGVREYWLIDPRQRTVAVVTFQDAIRTSPRVYGGGAIIVSNVLAALHHRAEEFFE
jgi:Uma2 family endonuclease